MNKLEANRPRLAFTGYEGAAFQPRFEAMVLSHSAPCYEVVISLLLRVEEVLRERGAIFKLSVIAIAQDLER